MFAKSEFTRSVAKLTKSLHNTKNRNENKLFLIEGYKCCSELLNSKYITKYLIINKSRSTNEIFDLASKFAAIGVKIYEAEDSIFQKLADTVSPQSVLAVAQMPLAETKIVNNSPIVILDNISDPGNVGTIIRTADWFGIKQIILAGECASKYSPKVVRAAMGSIFRLNVLEKDIISTKQIFSSEEFNKSKAKIKIRILAATINSKTSLKDINISKEDNFCLIVGNESRGISPELEEIITDRFIIFGSGSAESLNVAVAFGVSLFSLTA